MIYISFVVVALINDHIISNDLINQALNVY